MLATREHATELTVQTWIASWDTQTEVRRLRCVSREWSRTETPYEVLQHRTWEIASGYEGNATTTLAHLYIAITICAVRSCASHPFHCCSVNAFTELKVRERWLRH